MQTHPKRGSDAPGFEMVLMFIEQHLTDPDLKPSFIAARCGVSPRSLQLLFSRRGTTVMRHLWRRRIEFCHAMLQADDMIERTLMDIALDGGFSSATHFGRHFKARYGVSPSCFRKQSLRSAKEESRADRISDQPIELIRGVSQAGRRRSTQIPGGGS